MMILLSSTVRFDSCIYFSQVLIIAFTCHSELGTCSSVQSLYRDPHTSYRQIMVPLPHLPCRAPIQG